MLLSDEQSEIRDVARRFAREKVAPGYQGREGTGRVERDLLREMGSLGLIAPELPEEFGGLAQPSVTTGLIAEEIGYADINVAYVQILGSLNGAIISRYASPELAAEWVGRIVSGESVVAIGLTEPRGGGGGGGGADPNPHPVGGVGDGGRGGQPVGRLGRRQGPLRP